MIRKNPINLENSELNIFIIGKSTNPQNKIPFSKIGEIVSISKGYIGLKDNEKTYYTKEKYACECHQFKYKFKQNDKDLITTWGIYDIEHEINEKLLQVLLYFLDENGQSNKKNNVIVCMNSENNREEILLTNALKKLEETNNVLNPFIIYIGNYPINQDINKLDFINHLPNYTL